MRIASSTNIPSPIGCKTLKDTKTEAQYFDAMIVAYVDYTCIISRLVVCANTLNARGLCALAKSLYTNQTLREIYIWGNNLEKDACQVCIDCISYYITSVDAT